MCLFHTLFTLFLFIIISSFIFVCFSFSLQRISLKIDLYFVYPLIFNFIYFQLPFITERFFIEISEIYYQLIHKPQHSRMMSVVLC